MKAKKLASLLLAGSLVLSLAACGNTGSSTSQAPNNSTPPASTESKTPEVPAVSDVKWPDGKDVHFDVPARAGGGNDMMVRFLTTPWTEMIDGNIVVDNYDTAEVGAQHTAKAAPDGLTLTIASSISMDNYLTGASDVNPAEDLTVIGKFIAGGPQAIIAKADAPFNNLKELAEYAKAHPGELNTGVGLGSTSHLCFMNLAKAMGNLEFNYVQAPSEADKLTNIAGGSLDLANCSMNNAVAYEADGKLKVLGILGINDELGKDDLTEGLSDNYLTTWEQGFPGASWMSGGYICGPAGMDPALVQAINESMQQVKDAAHFVDGMKTMNQVIEFKSVEESQADFNTEWELQVALTTELGINVRN